jgi:hypothetical protein
MPMPCKTTATATYGREKLLQHVELCCAGDCPEGAKCCVQISFDHHGGARTWCGCGPEEPKDCHLVLVTPGPGSGGGHPELVCAGSCPHKMRCVRKDRQVRPNVIQHWCECV